MIAAELPEISGDPAFVGWSDQTVSLLPEVAQRYSILELLRNDDWLTALLESAGITTSSTSAESVQGVYGVVERKITTVTVPSLSDVRVTRTGLRLVFGHQPGRSAKDWNARIDALRAGSKQVASTPRTSESRMGQTARPSCISMILTPSLGLSPIRARSMPSVVESPRHHRVGRRMLDYVVGLVGTRRGWRARIGQDSEPPSRVRGDAGQGGTPRVRWQEWLRFAPASAHRINV